MDLFGFDSVGAETFEDSVRCTHILGTVGLFGVASGQPEPVHLMLQDPETARKFVRPSIYAYTKATEQLRALARQTFEDIAGVLEAHDSCSTPFKGGARAALNY